MDYNINFPHLHIYLEHVGKNISIFGFTIAFYGILIAIGMIAGTQIARTEAKRTGQNPDDYLDFAIMGIIIAVICARLYYVAFSWDLYKNNPINILNIRQGGLAIYGGVLGGIFSAFLFSRIKKIKLPVLLDTACLGLVFGQAIGRWGNFFNREAFGGYTDNLFAMQIPVSAVRTGDISTSLAQHPFVANGVTYIQVHPTFLYESLWDIMVFVVLMSFRKHKKFNGAVFSLYLIGYGLGRSWIEGLRTDQLLIPGTKLPISQILSACLVLLGFIIMIVGNHRAKVAKKKFLEEKKEDLWDGPPLK